MSCSAVGQAGVDGLRQSSRKGVVPCNIPSQGSFQPHLFAPRLSRWRGQGEKAPAWVAFFETCHNAVQGVRNDAQIPRVLRICDNSIGQALTRLDRENDEYHKALKALKNCGRVFDDWIANEYPPYDAFPDEYLTKCYKNMGGMMPGPGAFQ